ncbi:MAG: hypothetical protein AAF713_15030 [Pseudomonadota bacterium]
MAFDAASAFGPDLYAAAQSTRRSMVAWPWDLDDLALPDADRSAGLAGNPAIDEIVGPPQCHMSMELPRDILV